MDEVWVVETWGVHGEGFSVLGVYESREAAFEALQGQPNMTVYTDEHGHVCGRPRKEQDGGWLSLRQPRLPEKWAHGYPVAVQQRKRPASDAFRLTGLQAVRKWPPPRQTGDPAPAP